MKQFLVSCFAIFFAINFAKASHIVGGEMYYDYLGNNQYRIYVALYRDCLSSGAPFDDPIHVGVFNSGNIMVDQIDIPFPGSSNLPVTFSNPCVTPPSNICVERAIYVTVRFLPPTPGGYTLAYQRCCRGPNVTNLSNPDDTGLTLTCHIPTNDQNFFENSSARFSNYPPLLLCNNENLNFDHSATDPDGDVLTYELVTPNAGANSVQPAPNPPPAPTYPLVSWAGGFSAATPLGAGSTTTIDPNTGALFADANLLGLYVVGIRVNEWRNGVIISSTTRDFLFRVVNCVVVSTAVVTPQEQTAGFVSYCQGLTFTFDNQSTGALNYAWDFGVSGTTTDVSSAFEPTYTFPSSGTYQVRLIANPGCPFADTTFVSLTLSELLNLDINFQDSTCFIGNSTDFFSVVTGGPGGNTPLNLQWNFGPNGTPQTSAANNVIGVTFDDPANNFVKLVGTSGACADSITYPIFFHTPPTTAFSFQPNHECLGLTQTFINNTPNANSFQWDFGVPGMTTDVSTAAQPTFTFPAPGTYTITLISENSPGCGDTLQQNITVYEPLSVSFTHPDSLCVLNNSIDFTGNVTGPSITTYSWNFGPFATPQTATTESVNGVFFSQAGLHNVSLTASFLQCSETETSTIFLYHEPTIEFSVNDGLRCAPSTVYFTSNCTADTDILYFWDFGDGGTSNEENPGNVYLSPGQYTVTLKIITVEGCLDTLTLTKIGLIVIHPNPVADFSIDKNQADICNSEIQFFDHSQGALTHLYIFDDANGATSTEENPVYSYVGDGQHVPILIVQNEFGCTDTARTSLFIDPFSPYIPNAFTPDGNEFNNEFHAVVALEAVSWKMEIFNRWGQLVFETNDQNDYWDGTYNGLAAVEGVYIYKVTYTPCGIVQNEEIISGHVSLLR